VKLYSYRRVMTVAAVAAVSIAVGGVTESSMGWFQEAGSQEAVDQARGQAALTQAREHSRPSRPR
jgi:hypothetical protein